MIFQIAEAMLTFEALTNDKLQKLCYFAYAWYLTFFGKRLWEERFEAWEKGPVCPELYEKYKYYGLRKIPRLDREIVQIIPDGELREFLTAVYDAHGHLKPHELLSLVCSEEPCLMAWKRLEEGESSIYYDEEIVNWYTRKILRELNRDNTCLVYGI
jgi:uncharacterized phage-associated protein